MRSSNILIDVETGTEIIFDALEPAFTQTYNSDLIEYSRYLDGVHITDLVSPNQRQMQVVVRTTTPSDTRRKLDYYRMTGKPLVMFIAAEDSASQVIVKSVDYCHGKESAASIQISLACYGVEGHARMATDSRCYNDGEVSNDMFSLLGVPFHSLLGNAVKLDTVGEDVSWAVSGTNGNIEPGIYMMLVRARGTEYVLNDMGIRFRDSTDVRTIIFQNISVDTVTGYQWFAAIGTVLESSDGHNFSIMVFKTTNATNSLYIDAMAIFPTSGTITIPTYTITGPVPGIPGVVTPTSYVIDRFQLDTVAGPRAVPLTTLGGAAHTASTSASGFYEQSHAGGDVKTFYYDWNKSRYLRILAVNVACDTETTLTVYHCWRVLGAVKRLHAYTMTLTAAQAKAGVNTDYPIVLDVPHGTIGWIETRAADACTVSVNVVARYNSITF
jgi:hypothetical protein